MGKSNKKQEKPKRRFSEEQYQMLKRCSDKKDMTEWNDWRMKNPDEDILLEGAKLNKSYLDGAYLNTGIFLDVTCGKEGRFQGAVHLEGANLRWSHVENAKLLSAHLESADLEHVWLTGTTLWAAHLENANLTDARLQQASLSQCHIEGANLRTAIVDGGTAFWKCKVDGATDFRGVGLSSCRIDTATKQLLEYNVRRINWEDWYKEHWFLKWPVRWFWCLSDYGISTWRVIIWFLGLALLFAAIYANCAYWWPPGIVSDLTVEPHLPIWHYFLLLLLRPIYFSVVTMTTLGFGDMYANAQSIWGHIFLSLQVILGYVLLGALVTRFAVLFTAGGPAGKFSNDK